MSDVQTEFTEKESSLSRSMGIPRGSLREARSKLLEGTDWAMVNNAVMYSETGMKRLERVLTGKTEYGPTAHAEKATGPVNDSDAALVHAPAPPVQKKCVVTSVTRNRQILMANIDEKDCRVRVRSSENFVPGMELTVHHIDEDLYEFIGRCPRAKGRW